MQRRIGDTLWFSVHEAFTVTAIFAKRMNSAMIGNLRW